eukprot:761627-Hanusia_phi.AAC.1
MAARISIINQDAAQSLVTNFSEASIPLPSVVVNETSDRTSSDLGSRSKRTKYTAKCCAECKLKKRKCSEVRPCVMCIMAGTSDKCLEEARTVALSTCILDPREAYFQDVDVQEASLRAVKDTCSFTGVNISLVRPLWDLGFDVSILFKAFRILPLDLKVALDELVNVIRQGHINSSRCNPEYQALLSQQSGMGRLSQYQQSDGVNRLRKLKQLEEDEEMPCFDQFACNERWGHGRWLSVEFDSKLNCKRMRIGDEMANLLGCHHTEILSRFICHDLVKSMSEYELLVAWTSSTMCSFNSLSIFYIKVMRGDGQQEEKRMIYLKCTFQKNFNDVGIQIGYTIVFERASPEAYQLYKNRFLPPTLQLPVPDADIDRWNTRESIVFMRKSRLLRSETDRLSYLADLIKRWVAEVRTCHPLFRSQRIQETGSSWVGY